MAQLIDGKKIAAELKEQMVRSVEEMREGHGTVPGLAVVLVGEDPASISYVTSKERSCTQLGIHSAAYHLEASTSQEELLDLIDSLNKDEKIDGILVQLPLPSHIDEQKVILAIDPKKDVDGFHPESIGRMMTGMETFYSCTPYGIVKLLEVCGIETEGKHVCIVGRSNIVGKPLANLLLAKGKQANATVTVCHSRTPDIGQFTRQADIVVAAVGIPQLITADMVADDAVVIDVGVNRVEDATRKRGYRLVGDVLFDEVKEKASYITPVPGGVGPMTITMLMHNTIESARRRIARSQKEVR